MFGYITVDKPEMKVKDFYRYKAYYCGLCKSLQENYGLKGRVTLSYDVTFLVLVLTSLYEPKEEKSESRCPIHPIKKIPVLQNEISRYGADMNLLLAYYHFEDDWKDEKSLKGIAGIHFYKKQAKKICKEEKLERLITQKWIAMWPLGQEAWSEYRRTGYPRFFPLLNGNVTNLPSANRIPFPPSEYIRNAANVNAAVSKLGGADNYQTKVWWQRRDK